VVTTHGLGFLIEHFERAPDATHAQLVAVMVTLQEVSAAVRDQGVGDTVNIVTLHALVCA